MKECFKNWVLTHEKLYKVIVFVIALVAFLAITAHGCKTMKADAATTSDGVSYWHPFSDLNWGTYSDYKEDVKARNDGFVIVRVNETNYTYIFNDSLSLCYLNGSWNGAAFYVITARDALYVNGSGVVTGADFNLNKPIGLYFKNDDGQFTSVVGSTFDYRNNIDVLSSMPHSNITYEAINEPAYLVNAPYFSHVSTEVQNPILLKNSALSKMYTEIQFELMGQPMTPAGGYKAEFFVDVYLPSIDLLYDLAYVRMTDSAEFSKLEFNSDKEYQEWWLDVSRGEQSYKKFTLRFEQEYSHPIDGYVTLLLPHDYLLECIETGYGSVSDMYLGQITENEWAYEEAYELLLKFMTVGQVGNIVHTYNYPDVYYGRYTTITYKANLSEPVITEYNDDYFANGGSDAVDKVVQEEINNAYNDIADKLQSDNQALQDMLDAYYRGENAFSDYNSSDVWSFLSDTTKGLVSVIPTLSGLSAVVGVVFGFLPIQIGGMIMTLFVICIFTAIIRFIRG